MNASASDVSWAPEELSRYGRHLLLSELGLEAQGMLKQARALIIGVGGLGSPVTMYFAASGVGNLRLVDDDAVSLSNLQRQIIHGTPNIGEQKVCSAKARALDINPNVEIEACDRRLTEDNVEQLFADVDVVMDCCDNFATRDLVTRAAVRHRVPVVSASAIAWRGQAAVYRGHDAKKPCYHCIFEPGDHQKHAARCASAGVVAPLVGTMGSFQALLGLKTLLNMATGEHFWRFDAMSLKWNETKIRKRADCETCGRKND